MDVDQLMRNVFLGLLLTAAGLLALQARQIEKAEPEARFVVLANAGWARELAREEISEGSTEGLFSEIESLHEVEQINLGRFRPELHDTLTQTSDNLSDSK